MRHPTTVPRDDPLMNEPSNNGSYWRRRRLSKKSAGNVFTHLVEIFVWRSLFMTRPDFSSNPAYSKQIEAGFSVLREPMEVPGEKPRQRAILPRPLPRACRQHQRGYSGAEGHALCEDLGQLMCEVRRSSSRKSRESTTSPIPVTLRNDLSRPLAASGK